MEPLPAVLSYYQSHLWGFPEPPFQAGARRTQAGGEVRGRRNPGLYLASGATVPFPGGTACATICLSSFREPKALGLECS